MARLKTELQLKLEHAAAYVLISALQFAPLRVANWLARQITRVLDAALPKLRRVALINLSFAFPELTQAQRNQITDGVFETVSRLLVSLARFPRLTKANINDWIAYEGLDNYQRAKEKGSGILVATAHLGNWELSAFAHALMTEPMHVMVRPLDNPQVDNLVEHRRTLSGNHLIYKREAARSVIRALRNNDAVGILIDQNTTPSEGVFIDFFGKSACAGSAFVKLAYHSNAAVIPGFALWNHQRQRYALHFYPEVELTGDVQSDTQHLHAILEGIIREHPEQWMWIHRRWKTRPPGEPPLY